MRIPKFRVWDNVDHMSKPFTLNELQAELVQFDCACPIMQYTGLKDVNGVEIYEGDVVEFSSHWDKHVCTVSFSKCKFGLGTEIKGELGINGNCTLLSFLIGSGCKGYTVIGNVHQNPELLEQNDE